MDRHVQNLGTLNVIYGALGLVIALGVLIQHGNLHNIYEAFNEDIYGVIAVAMVLFHIVIAAPCMLCGFFVKQYNDGARVGLTVVSALNMLAAPAGTALGAYGLWVLTTPETEPLFAHREAARRTAARKLQAKASAAKATGPAKTSTSILPSAE